MPCRQRLDLPAVLVGSFLDVGHGFDGVLPSARLEAVVRTDQIRLGNLPVQDGLAFGVVLGLDELLGVIGIWWCPSWCAFIVVVSTA